MQKNILIVDDDEDLSYIISEMLENYGYQVSAAADEAAAEQNNPHKSALHSLASNIYPTLYTVLMKSRQLKTIKR